jgi:hypothetical protein
MSIINRNLEKILTTYDDLVGMIPVVPDGCCSVCSNSQCGIASLIGKHVYEVGYIDAVAILK